MFDSTGQAKFEIGGKTYHVGRMKSADWLSCSHILNDKEKKLWKTVRPGNEMALYLEMSNLTSSECASIASYALRSCKEEGSENAVTEISFSGGMEFYWVLVCKVVIANFTNFASMAIKQLAKEELWEEVYQKKADELRKDLVSKLAKSS